VPSKRPSLRLETPQNGTIFSMLKTAKCPLLFSAKKCEKLYPFMGPADKKAQ